MEIDDLKFYVTDLTSPQTSEFVKQYVDELLSNGSLASSKDFFDFLTEKLNEQGAKMAVSNPTLYDQYEKYWIHLAFKVFSTLESADQENLIQQRLLFAVQQGYDLDELYKELFEWRGRLPETQTFVRSYVKILEQNAEALGNTPIEVEGRKLLPQVKNWILDYSKFPSQVSKRGSIERLNYVNKSSNTRSLTQIQRQHLLSVLKFYDDVLTADIPPKQRNSDYGVDNSRRAAQAPVDLPQYKAPVQAPQTHVRYSSDQPIDIQKKLNELKQRASK